jgi:hypothetical protein
MLGIVAVALNLFAMILNVLMLFIYSGNIVLVIMFLILLACNTYAFTYSCFFLWINK